MPQMTKLGENQATYTMNDLPEYRLSIQQINISSIFTQLSHTCNIQFNINPTFQTCKKLYHIQIVQLLQSLTFLFKT